MPSEQQRKIDYYAADAKRVQGNPFYGEFQAPGLKWVGKSSITTRQLNEEQELRIGATKKRRLDSLSDEGLTRTVMASQASSTADPQIQSFNE